MRHLELHIIQSVPVACLNRDDLNSPKTAVFGGVQRARVSSQAWKRAIREMAKEMKPELFKGDRTRRMVFALKNRLRQKDFNESCAIAISEKVADIVETLDSKNDAAGLKKIKTLMFFSDAEYDSIVEEIANSEDVASNMDVLQSAITSIENAKELKDKEKKDKELKKAKKESEKALKPITKNSIAKSIKAAQLKDAADIALFGRMVANDHSLSVEAASMFSHAISTHKVDNEIDFFAAVDDLQSKDDSGAGMTSTLEFNAATYYRFAALNLDMLADKEHLNAMTLEERKSVVCTFIDATIKSTPKARRNSMNGNTLPAYVLGIVRETGHPIQLINAFENPIRSSNGYVAESVKLIEAEYKKLSTTWNIEAVYKNALPEVGIQEFLAGMVEYVV